MAEIKTGENVISILLEQGESLYVECKTQGANSPLGGNRVGFSVGYYMPSIDLSGLSVGLPYDNLYADENGAFYVLPLPGRPDKIHFEHKVLHRVGK